MLLLSTAATIVIYHHLNSLPNVRLYAMKKWQIRKQIFLPYHLKKILVCAHMDLLLLDAYFA